jgi:dsDNA-specific endonuclease/ATPase MutS2
MRFAAGSAVAVVNLRQHGRVLEGLTGGRYRVAIGTVTMVCDETQLETVSHSKKAQRHERARATEAPAPPVSASVASPAPRSLDLHGLTVPEALATLPGFLDGAIRAGLGQVEIIHGISGGRLRIAVRDFLAKTPSVTLAVRDDKNPGVTIAYF